MSYEVIESERGRDYFPEGQPKFIEMTTMSR